MNKFINLSIYRTYPSSIITIKIFIISVRCHYFFYCLWVHSEKARKRAARVETTHCGEVSKVKDCQNVEPAAGQDSELHQRYLEENDRSKRDLRRRSTIRSTHLCQKVCELQKMVVKCGNIRLFYRTH